MATKYVSALDGQQMDAALTDMAYHTSEAFAIGERNGVPVGAGDVAYQNNSKYYANSASSSATTALDAAARAEAAVPPSTAGAVFFDRAQSLTTAQQVQAKANISAGSTNPNLLDNAYFVGGGSQLGNSALPINQRGQTSYSGINVGLDRWKCWNSTVITLNTNGLYVDAPSDGAAISESIEYRPEYSQTPITVSFLTTDDKLVAFYFLIDTSISWQGGTLLTNELPEFYIDIAYSTTPNILQIVFCKSFDGVPRTVTLKAAKVEVGTMSTIRNDPPPNFQQELAKCQRYLYIMGGAPYTMFGSGIAESTSYIMATVQFPVPMRATPTLSTSGAFRMWGGIGYEFNVSGIGISSYIQIPTNCPYGGISCSTSGSLTIGNIYYLQSNSDTTAKLIFSAEI